MVTTQVLHLSYCEVTSYVPAIWSEITDISQLALGVLMCLLVAIQFVTQSLQMYKATKRFQLSRYMNLLVREGMIYFLAYVYSLSFFPFRFGVTRLTADCYS